MYPERTITIPFYYHFNNELRTPVLATRGWTEGAITKSEVCSKVDASRSLQCTGSATQTLTNQSTLPLWSIHGSLDYSHGTHITDAGPVAVIIFLLQMSTKKSLVSWCVNSSYCQPITGIVRGRCPSVFEIRTSVSFFFFFPCLTHTDDENHLTHILPSPPPQQCNWAVKPLNSL